MKLLRLPEVLKIVPVSKTTIWRMVKLKKFPAPIELLNSRAWKESDIQSWLANQRNTLEK